MRYYTGFTLLEVMISLAIFAIAGISIMKNISEQLILTKALEDKMASSWVADNVLAEIKIMNVTQSGDLAKGRHFMLNQFWYWQTKEVYNHSKGYHEVIVEIRSQENNEHPNYIVQRHRITND
ncbi:type II secretion system minor pseudopilin GspI [Yersinia sp. 2541 StPb PI]|uniref:type II secretion system minor pseudopilin GspI n=1 Tax=Yersinia sp. 2541 StPb PI TaxID=3117407 RepID=UPI003FA43BA5